MSRSQKVTQDGDTGTADGPFTGAVSGTGTSGSDADRFLLSPNANFFSSAGTNSTDDDNTADVGVAGSTAGTAMAGTTTAGMAIAGTTTADTTMDEATACENSVAAGEAPSNLFDNTEPTSTESTATSGSTETTEIGSTASGSNGAMSTHHVMPASFGSDSSNNNNVHYMSEQEHLYLYHVLSAMFNPRNSLQ